MTESAISTPKVLDDLRLVGSEKPMGYLSRRTIREAGSSLEAIQSEVELLGLATMIIPAKENAPDSETIFVYHNKALRELLNRNQQVLKIAGWPTEPAEFIQWVSNRDRDPNKVVPIRTPLYSVIADAFGDKSNGGV